MVVNGMASTTYNYDVVTLNVDINNSTAWLTDEESERVSTTIKDKIMRGVYVGISSIGIVGNVVVLVVLLSLVKMRKKLMSIFVINQSIVDGVTAVFLLLTTLLPSDGREYKTIADDLYCRLWVTRLPLWISIHCSTYNLVALTLERYLSVVHPIRHKMAFNRRKAMIMVTTAWFIAILYNVAGDMPVVYIANGLCVMMVYPSKASMRIHGIVGAALVYFIPILMLIYCYSMMAYALRTKVAPAAIDTVSGVVNDSQPNQIQNKPNISMKARAKKNVIKTFMIVTTAFIFCTSWNQWFFFLFNLGLFDFRALSSNFYHFSVVAMFANCCVNPFIYAVQYEEFQKGLRKIFRRSQNQVGQQSSVVDSSAV